jgi:hypothetical protein
MLSNSARFRWIEHRRLPRRHDVAARAPNRRVGRRDAAGNQPIEQMPDRSEALFDARRRELARRGRDPDSDMRRLHNAHRSCAGARAPGRKLFASSRIGATMGGLRMFAAKNSRKRLDARSPPVSPTSAGNAGGPIAIR